MRYSTLKCCALTQMTVVGDNHVFIGLNKSLGDDSATQEEHSDVPPSPQQPGTLDTPPSAEGEGQPKIMSPGHNRTSRNRQRGVNGRPGCVEGQPTPTPRGEEQPMPTPRGEEQLMPPHGEEQPMPTSREDDLPTSPQGEEQPAPTPTGEEQQASGEEQPTPPSRGKKQISERQRSSTGSSSSVGDEGGVSRGGKRKVCIRVCKDCTM